MDEARRFLRYVFPGLVFIIELPLILLISDGELFFSRPEGLFWKINSEANRNLLFGLPLTVLVISGGLGYLFSIFHHFLYWYVYASLARVGITWFICDHRKMLKEAASKEYLLICSQGGQQLTEIEPLATAWRLTSAFWHERIQSSERIKSAEPRVTSIADMMHGAGSSFLACTSAIAVWFFVVKSINDKLTFEPRMYYIVPVILLIVHLLNYLKMVKHTQGVINTICADVFRDVCETENKQTILIAS